MRIKFLKRWRSFKADQRVDIADGAANLLIRRGIAVEFPVPPGEEPVSGLDIDADDESPSKVEPVPEANSVDVLPQPAEGEAPVVQSEEEKSAESLPDEGVTEQPNTETVTGTAPFVQSVVAEPETPTETKAKTVKKKKAKAPSKQ